MTNRVAANGELQGLDSGEDYADGFLDSAMELEEEQVESMVWVVEAEVDGE